MSDSVEPLLRALVALGVVLALLWGGAKGWRRTSAGKAAANGVLGLVARQTVGRGAAVALVRVGSERVVLVGVTEQGVSLLGEMPAAEVLATEDAPVPVTREPVDVTTFAPVLAQEAAATRTAALAAEQRGALAGSALSPQTWRQAVDVLKDRSTRR